LSGYLLDTSILIGAEGGSLPGEPPDGDARLSVVTLTELRVGVLRASSEAHREKRLATLERARSFIALPFDDYVAEPLAELIAAARERRRRLEAMDAIIAATAIVHDLVVWTQDDDFEVLAELAPELEIARA